MNTKTSIIEQISSNFTTFSNAEQRISEVILENPENIVDMSIGKIASIAQVSEPSIIRFCRLLGFEGFKEFKIKLTQELAAQNVYVHREVKVGDSAETYVHNVTRYAINSITDSLSMINPSLIEEAVIALSNASKIEFWGYGASAVVAKDAYHKFFRLGVPCIASEDTHMQAMSAGVLNESSVVIAISHTGRSKELIENINLANDSGVFTIGITSSDSPLSKACTMAITVDTDEDTSVFTPMVSRLVHLLIIDMLAIGVTLQKGSQVTAHLKEIKSALNKKKFNKVSDD